MLEESRLCVLGAVASIDPCDTLEAAHKADVVSWILSGAPLFRVRKPDDPPRHLVSYFALVDVEKQSLLLVDHRNARKWLPTGGHVEPDEDPCATVEREVMEELGIPARFASCAGPRPLFLTVAETVGLTAGHTDVSLWYVLEGSVNDELLYDATEFAGVRWFTFDEIERMEEAMLDPHMKRFIGKMRRRIADNG